ncbi:hypothetical protein GF342_06035 [Candidatus Woesearchaeota archaeon]|nr:hypothetical protein [Candidatus Woesearchaeota archaeon]
MMRQRHETKKYCLPPVLDSLEGSAFRDFLTWERSKGVLKRMIVDPFTEAATSASCYCEARIPDEPVLETLLETRVTRVQVKSEPGRPSVSWKKVVTSWGDFLDQLADQYREGVSREGVWTPEGAEEPFVEISTLTDRLAMYQGRFTSPVSGPKQSVIVEGQVDTPEHLFVAFAGRNYHVVNEGNALDVVRCKHMTKEGDARCREVVERTDEGTVRIPRFYELLKSDLQQQLGRPDHATSVFYGGTGDLEFEVVWKPNSTCSYSDIPPHFVKPVGSRITRRSRIGDLVVMELLAAQDEVGARIIDRGLVPPDMIDDYNPCLSRRGNPSVRLEGVRDRLQAYREQETRKYEEINRIELALESLDGR